MDSLTQIVLGAAVGEVCLGKKIGNRAMFWGGVAGTIPDLDVFALFWLSPLDSLVIHRGYSHSLVFAVLFSFLIAYLVKHYYDSRWYRNKTLRTIASIAGTVGVIGFFTSIAGAFYVIGLPIFYTALLGIIIVGFGVLVSVRLWREYGLKEDVFDIKVDYKNWYWFFFWTIVTHPILDNFTTYGTQLFLPFSDYRSGFNNIAVADPFYTVPFGILLIAASFYSRNNKKRNILAWLSIIVSSAYMLFTIFNKMYINSVVEKTIKEENIQAIRYTTCPSILNNILWSTTIETNDGYFIGQYSWFDKDKKFTLKKFIKDHHLLGEIKTDDYTIDRLKWFSNGYYNVIIRKDGRLQLNDVRFGLFDSKLPATEEENYIFRFVIEKKTDGKFTLVEEEGGPPRGKEKDMFPNLWKRIKGI
jgi:inner membrane protein